MLTAITCSPKPRIVLEQLRKKAALEYSENKIPITIKLSGLGYSVPADKGARVTILKDVEGVFSPGKLTGILGPSGAGKTTLLNLIALKATSGEMKGQYLVNDVPIRRSYQVLSKNAAYVVCTLRV